MTNSPSKLSDVINHADLCPPSFVVTFKHARGGRARRRDRRRVSKWYFTRVSVYREEEQEEEAA